MQEVRSIALKLLNEISVLYLIGTIDTFSKNEMTALIEEAIKERSNYDALLSYIDCLQIKECEKTKIREIIYLG